MSERAVIVRYPAGDAPTGAEYEIESAEKAAEAHPDAAIVRWADTGEPYDGEVGATPHARKARAAREAGLVHPVRFRVLTVPPAGERPAAPKAGDATLALGAGGRG